MLRFLYALPILLLLTAPLQLLAQHAAPDLDAYGYVVCVVDGDTVYVLSLIHI